MATTVTSTSTLTAGDVQALARVLDLVERGAHVRFVTDAGDVRSGTVRHLCADADTPAYPARGQDVRDTYVRITMDSGWEAWHPMGTVCGWIRDGFIGEG